MLAYQRELVEPKKLRGHVNIRYKGVHRSAEQNCTGIEATIYWPMYISLVREDHTVRYIPWDNIIDITV